MEGDQRHQQGVSDLRPRTATRTSRSVEQGKDDREVIVPSSSQYADWQSIFNPFYPASTNKDPKIFNEGWKDTPLTTAGPFKLENIDHTTQDDHARPQREVVGRTDRSSNAIVFRVIDPDAQIDALANGEIDAMDIGPDANKYNARQGHRGRRRSASPAARTSGTSRSTARARS